MRVRGGEVGDCGELRGMPLANEVGYEVGCCARKREVAVDGVRGRV